MRRLLSRLRVAPPIVLFAFVSPLVAQTTGGIGTTIVFPVTAQTTSFASQATLFNPGATSLTASVKFYEANNSATPGLKTCSDVTIAASRSAQIALSTQCTLTAASHFGLLIVADKASPQSHNFYGFMRVQNPQGIGFSVEGFPVENFNNQVSDAIGLKKQAAAPGYQTNCFVGSLDQPMTYSVKLFNGFSGSQIGSTLTGSLSAFQQIRYLDIFGASGVNAPAGDQSNVRAEFTQTSGGTANLVGFCTVQDNSSFGADFRVAKSYGSPSSNFFAQGGNAFGATATLGTTDNQVLNIIVDGARVMRYEPNAISPNILGGYVNNGVYPGVYGTTIAGGGAPGTTVEGLGCPYAFGCQNSATDHFGTIGGGAGNLVGDTDGTLSNDEFATVAGGLANAANKFAAVAGGTLNIASGEASVVSGGRGNQASGYESFVAGGEENVASGNESGIVGGASNTTSGFSSFAAGSFIVASGNYTFAAGLNAHADREGTFVWADTTTGPFSAAAIWGHDNTFTVRSTGGAIFVTGVDASFNPASGVVVTAGAGSWSTYSDRNGKENIESVDPQAVLEKLMTMPVATWKWKTEDAAYHHMGPMAQDFYAAFNLGHDDKHIVEVDANGVAFAAIQGLDLLLHEKDARIDAQQAEIAAQEAEIVALERRLQRIEAAIAQTPAANSPVAASQH